MATDLVWEDMHAGEAFAVGADWAPQLGGDTIDNATAVLLSGDVQLNVNPPPAFTPVDGSVQYVWRSGGTAGICRVMVTANTTDGRVLKEIYTFRVL